MLQKKAIFIASLNPFYCVTDHVRKMCPHYDILDDVFGEKVCFSLPYLYDNLDNEIPEDLHAANNSEIDRFIHCDQETECEKQQDEEVPQNIEDEIRQVEGHQEPVIASHFNSSGDTNELTIDLLNDFDPADQVTHTPASVVTTQSINDYGSYSPSPPTQAMRPANPPLNRNNANQQRNRNLSCNDNNNDGEGTSSETISRFRLPLSTLPQSSNGFKPKIDRHASNAAAVIASALTQRAEAATQKNENELALKWEEIKIAKEKMEFDKQMRVKELELKKLEIESKEKIQILTLQKEERLAELKIRLEMERTNAR